MNKIGAYNKPTDIAEFEYGDPDGYGNIYSDEYHDRANPEDETNLFRSLFATIQNHWFLIVSINLIVTVLAIVYVAQKPNFYRSEARIQVNTEISPGFGNKSSGSVILNNAGADPAYFSTQLQILEGSGLMRRVIKTLDLQNNQEFLSPQSNKNLSTWQNVKKMLGFYRPSDTDKKQIPASSNSKNNLTLNTELPLDTDTEAEKLAPFVNLLKSNLDISPVKDSRTNTKETRLIDIEFTHQDPVVAAKIANAVGDAYVLQNLENKVQSNASAGDFLQKRVAELQSQIRLGEERLMNYARTNQIISLDSSQNTVVQRFAALNASLGQAENDRIAAQTAYQAALQNQMWKTESEGKDPQVNVLEGKLNELRQKLAQLKTQYTDDWFEVVQTKKQIENVDAQLKGIRQRASGTQLAALQQKLNEAVARERVFKANFDQQKAEVIQQNEASINYKIIQQEVDTNKSLLDGLLQSSKENEIVLSGTQNNVLVLDRAMIPANPSGPERNRSILVAFFASLGIGLGLAFMIDWLNDSVSYAQDLEGIFGLPVLGAVPAAPLSFGRKLLPSGLRLNGKHKPVKRTYDLQVFEMPQFLESYMQMGTYLLLSTAGGPPHTVLITSGEEGEGKTITALNLATSLAKTKGKVLIIDADLRCPRIHKIKELNNKIGLTTLLAMPEFTPELIDQAIQKDPNCNLDIMTSGEHTLNPGNLLSSKEMGILLKQLTGMYSHIIIDSSPALYFADSAIISTMADAVILVVRDNVSSKGSVLSAKKALQRVGAKIIGIVLNGVPIKRTNYYKQGYYQSHDGLTSENGNHILKLH